MDCNSVVFQSVASQVPFHDFAVFCEKLCCIKGIDKKKDLFCKFVTRWRETHSKMHGTENTADSFFPAMRFMLPHLDKDRLSYGMKEVVLAKYYIDVLSIAKESDDAKALLNYRAPAAGKKNAGDFATVAYDVLKNRSPEKGTFSVEEINASLDVIAQSNASKRRDLTKKELHKLITNTSALEQKWLLRIMLKDMKFGLNENSIFPVFHPEAQDLYNVCNSLSKVCLDLHDISTKLNDTEITLFTPFRPMLGQRCSIDDVEKLMNNEMFIIETKIDGERMQVHKNGEEFRYFSRGANDYTSTFGATPFRGSVTPHIAPYFKPNINTCILDGEMVGFDTELNDFVLKGSNIDIKSESLGRGLQACFVVFDVLMINDEKLANVPLRDRITRCEDVFDPCPGRIVHVNRRMGRVKNDVVDSINDAIDNREEGIVIKDPLSLYKPSKRKGSGWLKLKPEYVDSLSDQLDLLILGGEYGSGRRRGGIISHFLLGVADSKSIIDGKPKSFLTLGKVGSGYSDKELSVLLGKLQNHWEKFDPAKPPLSIQFTDGFKEKPDVWIKPENSVIVQVKAAEITNSEKYGCGYTLRFPRVERIRDDKQWFDCLTFDELRDLQKIANGRLTYKLTEASCSSSEPAKKKKRMTLRIEKPRRVAEHFKGADITDVTEISQLFANKEMCVLSGDDSCTKQQLEIKIVEYGGTFVQNPGSGTLCVIAGRTSLRVKNIIKQGKVDVVKAKWLLQCFENKSILPYHPSDMLHATPSTVDIFRKDFDQYGDNYFEDVDEQKLIEIFSKIEEIKEEEKATHEDIADIESRYFDYFKLGLFRLCRLYVEKDQLDDADECFAHLEFKFHGGEVYFQLHEQITHILVPPSSSSGLSIADVRQQVRDMKLKPHIVTRQWIQDCLLNNKLLNEGPYEPK